jgi:ribosomal protein S18 acetylase RimI-like enzyme
MIYELRVAAADDRPFLWQMLYYAAHMDESGEPLESARVNPDLIPYVEGFGRFGDVGVIAIDAATGNAVGAAWLRSMPATWPLYSFVDAATPELAIAVDPSHIGRGAGSQMLACLVNSAATIYPAVALSVRANNPAKALYERNGFVIVAEITNRVGGKSFIMRAALTRPQ